MSDLSHHTSLQKYAALFAGVIVNAGFGSLYAWSVFIVGLESDLGIMRADVSIVFSLAIVSFTFGNFVSPYLFRHLSPAILVFIAMAFGVGGLSIAAMGSTYLTVITGYGLLFGFGCGFAYNTVLQTGQAAMPDRPGLANGIIISAFAAGSVISAYLLSIGVAEMGVRATFWLLAMTIAGIGILAMALLWMSKVRFLIPETTAEQSSDRSILYISWIGFFLGALAGVMAIGHAAAIITHFGGGASAAVMGVTLMSIGNATGRLGAGWLCDQISVRSVAGIAHLTGALGFVVVLANPTGEGAMVAMSLAGVAYGMTASVYPTTISIYLGRASYGKNFALLLTAWGAAGLLGPSIGGYFFDLTGDYRIPLELAAVVTVLALVNAMRLPRSQSST